MENTVQFPSEWTALPNSTRKGKRPHFHPKGKALPDFLAKKALIRFRIRAFFQQFPLRTRSKVSLSAASGGAVIRDTTRMHRQENTKAGNSS